MDSWQKRRELAKSSVSVLDLRQVSKPTVVRQMGFILRVFFSPTRFEDGFFHSHVIKVALLISFPFKDL